MACAPEPSPEPGVCPALLVEDVLACVDDWLGDPDNTEPADELVIQCADAEPLADAYDAWCAAEANAPAECGMSYEDAWMALKDPCAAEAAARLEG